MVLGTGSSRLIESFFNVEAVVSNPIERVSQRRRELFAVQTVLDRHGRL